MGTYVERLLLCHGVNYNDRVFGLQDATPLHGVLAVVIDLLRRGLEVGVDGSQTLQTLAEARRQTLEGADALEF